ncbi:MAG: hypothetical protein H7221_02335, partial [Flavobacterium sp.]|nr:hypothetical protein [Flavobacterium sp.]
QINFLDAKLLADVITTFAKKLTIKFDIKDIENTKIEQLHTLFKTFKGNHFVDFEIQETQKTFKLVEKKQNDIAQILDDNKESLLENEPIDIDDLETTIDGIENEKDTQIGETDTEMVEDLKIITHLEMPSRKLKVAINNELLEALEALQINFRLN